MMIQRSFMWNLEPSGKVINLKVVRRNSRLHVMSDGLMVDWIKRHHIIPLECRDELLVAIVRYALVDLAFIG